MRTRQQIIKAAKALRAEIEQIFADACYWNEHVRKPHQEPIDADPDGQLRRIKSGIDAMLLHEKSRPMN